MDIGAPLVPNSESTHAMQPGESALDDPTMPTEAFFALDSAPGDSMNDTD
jgi:hypothetical protein